jgi:hypothetical protein
MFAAIVRVSVLLSVGSVLPIAHTPPHNTKLFRRDPFFYGSDNSDQLVKIVQVLGSDGLHAYLRKYGLKLDAQFTTMFARCALSLCVALSLSLSRRHCARTACRHGSGWTFWTLRHRTWSARTHWTC